MQLMVLFIPKSMQIGLPYYRKLMLVLIKVSEIKATQINVN